MNFKPIIPWQGGKRRLAKHILPMLPEHQCYTEPFAGGAAIFFLKQPSKVEVLNDINSELVNLYRVVQNHLEELLKQFKWALVSRKMFEWEKSKNVETLTDIQRAARFFYLQKQAFGGRVKNQTFGYATTARPKINLLRIEEELSACHLRLAQVYIENLAWDDCMERYDREHTLHYLDPPYWQTSGYGIDFDWQNYEKISSLGKSIKGKMVFSINDHDDIRELFKDFNIREVDVVYTVGGAKSGQKPSGELIITNY